MRRGSDHGFGFSFGLLEENRKLGLHFPHVPIRQHFQLDGSVVLGRLLRYFLLETLRYFLGQPIEAELLYTICVYNVRSLLGGARL